MKITPIRTMIKGTQLGLGTGKDQGYEVFPTTNTLIKHFNMSATDRTTLLDKQNKKLNELPDYESINKLREYQIEDVKFLGDRLTAGCFNEQRTGKTPTALSTMKVKDVTKLLIIAPASTLYTWAEECKNWWFEKLPAIVVDGTASKRKALIDNWNKGALIISYECLRETQRTVKNEYGEIEEIYLTGDLAYIKKHKDIQGVILDEAHRIKNHKSK